MNSKHFAPIAILIFLSIAVAIGGSTSFEFAVAQANHKALEALEYAAMNRKTTLLLRIEAAKREISARQMTVAFTGGVRVTLGDTTIRCDSLVAYYEQGTASAGARAAEPGPDGALWIGALVARGAVVLSYQDQAASADYGFFDLDADLATLTGTIMVAQGQRVLPRGRLIVNLATGLARIEAQQAPLPR